MRPSPEGQPNSFSSQTNKQTSRTSAFLARNTINNQQHYEHLSKMATPSTTDTSMLDVFVLTFNCAKAIIDPQIFGLHLRGALQCGNDESPPQCWPDLIVL